MLLTNNEGDMLMTMTLMTLMVMMTMGRDDDEGDAYADCSAGCRKPKPNLNCTNLT